MAKDVGEVPGLSVRRCREWASPELFWTSAGPADECQVEERRHSGLPSLLVNLAGTDHLALPGLAKQGGTRSFRLRVQEGPWCSWKDVTGGPCNIVAVKVYSVLMPPLDKGWKHGEPVAAGIQLKPLDTLWLPSDTTLGDVAKAAEDVPGLEGLPDEQWIAAHAAGDMGPKSAVVPGDPPSGRDVGVVLLLGGTVIRVPVLGLERLRLLDFQPAHAEWELGVAVTSHQGLGEVHCLAISEVDGELMEGPQVSLTGTDSPAAESFADYKCLEDGTEATHQRVVAAMLEGTAVPILLAPGQAPPLRVELRHGVPHLVWEKEDKVVVRELQEERAHGLRPILTTLILQESFGLYGLQGSRRFRMRALLQTGLWSPWSKWLEVEGRPPSSVEVWVYSDIPGLLASAKTGTDTYGRYSYPYLETKRTWRTEALELHPVAVLELPSTTTLEGVALAAAEVEASPGECNLQWMMQNHQEERSRDPYSAPRRFIRTPGNPPKVEDAAFFFVSPRGHGLKVPLAGAQDLELRDFSGFGRVIVSSESSFGVVNSLMISEADGQLKEGPPVSCGLPCYRAMRSGELRRPVLVDCAPRLLMVTVFDCFKHQSCRVVPSDFLLEELLADFLQEYATEMAPALWVVLPASRLRIGRDSWKIPLSCWLGLEEEKRSFRVLYEGANGLEVVVKTLTGKETSYFVYLDMTVGSLKELIFEEDGVRVGDQKLIFAHKQLKDDRTLEECGIQHHSVIWLWLNLRGPLPYCPPAGSPGESILLGNRSPSQEEVEHVVRELGGDLAVDFAFFPQIPGLSRELGASLRKLLDEKHQNEDDLELFYVPEMATELLGDSVMRSFRAVLGTEPDEVRLRRVEAHRRVMTMHLDADEVTVQIPLNSPEEYEGGELIYLNEKGLTVAPRPCLSATRHGNRIVHGVAELRGGVRYSMYLLKF